MTTTEELTQGDGVAEDGHSGLPMMPPTTLRPGEQADEPPTPEQERAGLAPLHSAITRDWPKHSLADLLRLLSESDEALAINIDPAQVVGDLKDKVDAIKVVLDRLKFQETWCRQRAAPFLSAAQSCKSNHDRLKEYVAFTMSANGFEELPGATQRIKMQRSPPSLAFTQPEANVVDFVKYPTYVTMHRSYYTWNTSEVETALKDKMAQQLDDETMKTIREFSDPSIPFAKLTFGSHPRFYLNKPAELPPKKKKGHTKS